MECIGNITAACVVFSGRYLLPLISSVDWPMMQVMSEYFGRMMKSFAFACDIFCAYIVVPTIREPLHVCKGFPAYTIPFSPPSLSEFQQVMLTKSRATRQSQGRLQDCAQGDDDRHQDCLQTKKSLVLGEPSSHVSFLGLRPDFSEADVCRCALYIFEYRAESTLYF
jgi:hypothetical protein